MMSRCLVRFVVLVATVASLWACAGGMRRAERVAPLTVTFGSPEWTGQSIPPGAQCRRAAAGGLPA